VTGFAVLVFVIALIVSGALLDQRRLEKQFGSLNQYRIKRYLTSRQTIIVFAGFCMSPTFAPASLRDS